MHRPSTSRLVMLASALSGMMRTGGDALRSLGQAASDGTVSFTELQSAMDKVAPRYGHQKSQAAFMHQESRRPTEDYKLRQIMSRRHANGLPVPKEVAEALDAAAARRAPMLARRARMYASGMVAR